MRSHLIPTTLFLIILCFSLFLAPNQSPWLFLTFLVSFFFSTWLVPGGFAWHRFYGNTTTAPGPIGWPILGCLPIMGPLAHRKLAGLAEAHKSRRLMALSLGASPVIVGSHPDTAREILHGPAFCDRPVKASARGLMFERAIGFAPSGDHWRHLRHIAGTNMFSPRRVAALEGLRRRAADGMIGRVRREMEESEKVEVREVLQEGSLETMVKSVFGESLGEEERVRLVKMVKEGYELIGKFNLEDYFPIMGGLLDFYGVGRKCSKLGDRVKALVGKIIEERRTKGGYYMQHDFLSLMLSLPKEESLSDSDIIAVLWVGTLSPSLPSSLSLSLSLTLVFSQILNSC